MKKTMTCKLKNGICFLVDTEDLPRIKHYHWSVCKDNAKSYVITRLFGSETAYLHRILMGIEIGDERVVDHINGDRLDNRKQNLRICTLQQNTFNRSLMPHSSKYKGVFKCRDKWKAVIGFEHKHIYLGSFESEKAAAIAYNLKAKKLFGEYAKLNKVA